MDWTREADVLEKILALLVALAGLADRAVGLPLARQLALLGFLAQAEATARSFVVGLPSGSPAVLGSRASDRAERLAADFRALALMLAAAIARARRRAALVCCVAPLTPPCRRLSVAIAQRQRHERAPTAPDTS